MHIRRSAWFLVSLAKTASAPRTEQRASAAAHGDSVSLAPGDLPVATPFGSLNLSGLGRSEGEGTEAGESSRKETTGRWSRLPLDRPRNSHARDAVRGPAAGI